jgi:hypothetical protein
MIDHTLGSDVKFVSPTEANVFLAEIAIKIIGKDNKVENLIPSWAEIYNTATDIKRGKNKKFTFKDVMLIYNLTLIIGWRIEGVELIYFGLVNSYVV